MSSVLRSVRKRKKGRTFTLGAVDVIDREGYAELEVDAKVELIRSLIPLGLLHIEELLDEEVTALAGERYARKDPSVGGRRHGSNPGTVGLAGQRVPIRVPRLRHVTEREIPLRSYEALHGDRAVNDLLLRRVLYGISCRNDAAAAEAIPGAIGLSGSTVSRAFQSLQHELEDRNQSAAGSLAEGLDETLTLHRLGVYGVLGRSLKTTNGLESINALIEERCHSGQRDETPRTPGAGPLRGGRCGPRAGRQDVRRGDDGRRAGHHDDGGQTVPGLCRDGHRERAGVDPVPPVLGRAGPRCFPGASGDRRWRQGAPGGRAARLPPPRPGATVSMAQARERGELPGQA